VTEAATEPYVVTHGTPSGIEVEYTAKPRGYRLRNTIAFGDASTDWISVPSVSELKDVLDKPGLPWWGMKIGVEGVNTLLKMSVLAKGNNGLFSPLAWELGALSTDQIVDLLTKHKLTVNHVRDKAGDRGTSVHQALEHWADTGEYIDPMKFPVAERGYVVGLLAFLKDIPSAEPVASEVMVGSLQHLFAGRYDVRIRTHEPHPVVYHRTPVRGPKLAILEPSLLLADLKTSKDVYESHFFQLELYEVGSTECGYEPTDARGVIVVGADGTYKLVRSPGSRDDALALRALYEAFQRMKAGTKA
jgi:hypothetical protein